MQNFAKASLFDLIMLYLRQHNQALIPPEAGAIDPLRNAHVPVPVKQDLLKAIWRDGGAGPLLAIGQGIGDIAYDPVWRAALASATPAVLFDKWRRFEVFAHSQNRVAIRHVSKDHAVFQRYTVKGNAPGDPENLLICGLIIGLLETIGCRDLCCEMALESGKVLKVRDAGVFCEIKETDALVTTGWEIRWQGQAQSEHLSATSENPGQIDLPSIDDAKLRVLANEITNLLMKDVARQWTLAEVAYQTGYSKRTLQRKLQAANLSFSHLIRLVRIHEACHLIQTSDTPMTVIGFCAGFSDSAHFARDFRASMGLSPSDYRAVC
ncbi:hypothetical protein MNBD_ALPHA08-2051 [hydrothermal vent metagenome]|uniref:HTH araC/xylS-type domain-containing protein n=1 Tax=hydrothermal vent metagenome TaxID=652676 RepID=A0A3B0RVF7_9ZZZZ